MKVLKICLVHVAIRREKRYEKMKKISICVCCYNEEENIELMYQAITKEMKAIPRYDYEIIFEDNASTDRSQEILIGLCEKDKHLKAIFNQTNYGADRSSTNLLMSSTGDAHIGITCDFQDPPTMIPQFIEEWENGYKIVWGQKVKSKESCIKRICRNMYYGIIDSFSDYKMLRNVIGFGLIDREALDVMRKIIKQDPLLHVRHLACELGYDIKLIPYEQQKRQRGKSSYNIARYFQFAVISLCNTSLKPLRIMTVVGMLTALLSLVVAAVYFIYKLTHWYTFNAGMAPLVIGMFFVSAVQLFCVGLLGEYVGIVLRRVTNKPVVVEKMKINFNEDKRNL